VLRAVSSLRRSMALAALLLAALSARAQGQLTAGISTIADILAMPLTAVGTRALQFGVIVPGTPSVTVLPNTAKGGEFRIAGVRNRKSIDISFTLPTQLTGPGGAAIPLSFNGNYAGLCEILDASGLCDAPSYATWNPVTTPSFHDQPTRYKPGRPKFSNDMYQVYLGGVAFPSPTLRGGTYTASIGVLLVVN
jgi:hypothetical protein